MIRLVLFAFMTVLVRLQLATSFIVIMGRFAVRPMVCVSGIRQSGLIGTRRWGLSLLSEMRTVL